MLGCLYLTVGYLCITFLWSDTVSLEQFGHYGKRAVYVICFVTSIAMVYARQHRQLDTVLRLFCYAAGVYAVLTLAAYFISGSVKEVLAAVGFETYGKIDHNVIPRLRFGGNQMDHPNNAAMVFGLAILVALRLCFTADSRVRARLIWQLLIAVFLIVLVLTQSRGPIAALLLTIPLVICLFRPKAWRTVTALVTLAAILGAWSIQSVALERVFPRGFDLGLRGSIYEECVIDGLQTPVFGRGIEQDTPIFARRWGGGINQDHCHNMLIDIFRFGGLVGVVLMSVLLGSAFVVAWRNGQEARFWGAVLFFGLVCVSGDGYYPITKTTVFWLVCWAPIGLLLGVSLKRSRENAGQ